MEDPRTRIFDEFVEPRRQPREGFLQLPLIFRALPEIRYEGYASYHHALGETQQMALIILVDRAAAEVFLSSLVPWVLHSQQHS